MSTLMPEDSMASMLAMQAPPPEEMAEGASFPAPQGFKMPDDVKDGDAFDVVAKVRLQDGMFMVESVNGMPVGDMEPEPELPPEEMEGEAATAPQEPPPPMTLMGAAKASGY